MAPYISEFAATPSLFGIDNGQGARQFAELGFALVLTSLLGWEREARQKSAGMRTHTLVGVGSALFMEVSIHGFGATEGLPGVSLDPSRVAAQIVSGIGFIGGGLIFVKRDIVRGLTTAATIWFACAIGMACGGGLPLLAGGATLLYFVILRGMPVLTARILPDTAYGAIELRLRYVQRRGVLGRALAICTQHGFQVTDVRTEPGGTDWQPEHAGGGYRRSGEEDDQDDGTEHGGGAATAVLLRLEGTGPAHPLVEELSELDDMRAVSLGVRSDATE
ncbi:MgtC/SapB family protein [Streptodolium elevatio]|uniref:MgtC/SapB family protein n=1 Tax=Streptodolium elevatio TaxID=3157996 RepID=A0ABV3D932_9ACTN